jgi:hypothetical protein
MKRYINSLKHLYIVIFYSNRMLLLFYKYNKFDTVVVSFIFFRNFILFIFSVLLSIGSNWK